MSHARRLLFLLWILLIALPVAAQRAVEIEFGETVEGEVDEDNPTDSYTFEGEEGQLVVISLTAVDNAYDTFLVLQGPDDTEVAVNDDVVGGNLNSRIGPLALPEDGEYTIVATSYGYYYSTTATAEGEYELTLQAVDARAIEYTQDVEGTLDEDNPQAYFTFSGQEGDVVNISVSGEDVATVVSLQQGGVILTSGDSTYNQNNIAFIPSFALPETGEYMLVVSSPTSDAEGDFTLSLARLEVNPIAFGDTVEVVFDEETPLAYYTFDAEVGDVVDLRVTGDGDFDTTLTVNGPDNFQVAYVDDAFGLDPAITDLIINQSGAYTVIVQPFQAGNPGEVTLSLALGELPTLGDEPLTVEFSADQTRATLRFDGVAGEEVRLWLEVVDGGFASPNVSVIQNQINVAYASGTTISDIAFAFVTSEDGDVIVQIDEYSYSNVTLLVTLERLGMAATPEATATVEPTATVEATADVTQEPAATATAEATDVTEEPAATATPEVTPTEEATDPPAATELPTVVPTELPTVEIPTLEPTVEVTAPV